MEERLYALLPSIAILSIVCAVCIGYARFAAWRFGPSWKSIDWHEKNRKKAVLHVGLPLVNIGLPVFEELVFRAPLVVAFASLDDAGAVPWLLFSSIVFGAGHWFGKKVSFEAVLKEREEGRCLTDDYKTEVLRYYRDHAKTQRLMKLAHVVVATLCGVVLGYLALAYQSVWLVAGAHILWNLVMPIVVMVLAIILYMLGAAGIAFAKAFWQWGTRPSCASTE